MSTTKPAELAVVPAYIYFKRPVLLTQRTEKASVFFTFILMVKRLRVFPKVGFLFIFRLWRMFERHWPTYSGWIGNMPIIHQMQNGRNEGNVYCSEDVKN